MKKSSSKFLFKTVVTVLGIAIGIEVAWSALNQIKATHTKNYEKCMDQIVRDESSACGCLARYPLAKVDSAQFKAFTK